MNHDEAVEAIFNDEFPHPDDAWMAADHIEAINDQVAAYFSYRGWPDPATLELTQERRQRSEDYDDYGNLRSWEPRGERWVSPWR